jgi:hypothetical protein
MSHPLYEILQRLDTARIHYTLGRYRDDVVTIHVTAPGARYEIEVSGDGEIDTCTFKGSEGLESGMALVEKIIAENKD